MNVRICLSPEELNCDFETHLLKLIKGKYEKTCMKSIGYIYEIISIKKIMYEEIMKMVPNVMFVINVKVKSYLPEANDEIELKVNQIFQHGIFGSIDKIKVLIPIQNCGDYIVEQDKKSEYYLIHKTVKTKQIKMNDRIHAQLKKIRYEKDTYSCLAKLQE